jgi:hypothetical protein
MKRVFGVLAFAAALVACVETVETIDGFRVPATWEQFAQFNEEDGVEDPNAVGYRFALGAAATMADRAGVMNDGRNFVDASGVVHSAYKYACFMRLHAGPGGETRVQEFGCPATPMPEAK